MKRKKSFSQEELRYLKLLAQQYPTVQAASSEIINLQAILNLPKGTGALCLRRPRGIRGLSAHPQLRVRGRAGKAGRSACRHN